MNGLNTIMRKVTRTPHVSTAAQAISAFRSRTVNMCTAVCWDDKGIPYILNVIETDAQPHPRHDLSNPHVRQDTPPTSTRRTLFAYFLFNSSVTASDKRLRKSAGTMRTLSEILVKINMTGAGSAAGGGRANADCALSCQHPPSGTPVRVGGMSLKLLLFGQARELAGVGETSILLADLPPRATAADVLEAIFKKCGPFDVSCVC